MELNDRASKKENTVILEIGHTVYAFPDIYFPKTFRSFQSRMWESLCEGCKSSSQALFQNMCLLLNISMFHNNEMAHGQTKHIFDISQAFL